MTSSQIVASGNNVAVPSFPKLFYPLMIEQLFMNLMGYADIWLLSMYDDRAVAAIGVVGQVLSIGTMILGIFSIGISVLLMQSAGSADRNFLPRITKNALLLNSIASAIMFLYLLTAHAKIIDWMNVPDELVGMATTYLLIVGFSLFFQGIMNCFTGMFRSMAYVKLVMRVSIATNALNILSNALVIFAPFVWLGEGVTGIALSTLGSRFVGTLLLIGILYKKFPEIWGRMKKQSFDRKIIKTILALGIPSGMENVSYNFSQTLLTGMIAGLGTVAVSSKIYSQTITSVIFTLSVAVGQALQIILGRYIGNKKQEEGYRFSLKVYRRFLFLFFGCALAIAVSGSWIIPLFTDNQDIIELVKVLLWLNVLYEPARAMNEIVIASLNVAGDVRYPVMMGFIVIYLFTIPMAYGFTHFSEFGLIAIWLTFIVDEWLRLILFFLRWQKGKWRHLSMF